MSRVWFDSEFFETSDGHCELISLGMVADDGRTFYAEAQFDEDRVRRESPWLVANVLPGLDMKPSDRLSRSEMRDQVEDFLHPKMALPPPRLLPELWAYFASSDWILLYRLWGRMIDMPKWMPHHPFCVQQWYRQVRMQHGSAPAKPPKPTNAHNALADAIWARDFWRVIVGWHVARGYQCAI